MTLSTVADQCSEATARATEAANACMDALRWQALGLDDAYITEGLEPRIAAYILRAAKANPSIRPTLAKATAMRSSAASREPRRQPSTIYFVRAGRAGHVKIGSASDVAARIKTLQTGCPDELRLIGTLAGGITTEQLLHDRFAHLHIRGEWFRATDELLHFIAGLSR